MRRISLTAALGALLFIAPACSEAEAATIEGTYNVDADATVKAMGLPVDQAEDFKKMLGTMITELKADMSYTSSMEMLGNKMSVKGTWEVKDGTVTFTQTHAEGTEAKDTSTGTIKDGRLTVDSEGKKMVFKKAEAK